MSITITSGAALRGALDRLEAVGGLGDDLDVGLAVEDHAEARAHQRLVVDDQDADRHCRRSRSVSRASTAKPRPARGPAESVPP